MSETFDALAVVKQVLVKHLLRQQIERDLARLSQVPLLLARPLLPHLESVHAALLQAIGTHKRQLRQQGVRIVEQEKNSLEFRIAYVERGYRVQHCFLLATLQAESHLLLTAYLQGDRDV